MTNGCTSGRSVVTMAEGQICVRTKGDTKCPIHTGHDLIGECKTCPRTLICSECIFGEHNGHKYAKLGDCVKVKMDNILSSLHKVENTLVPDIKQQITSTKEKRDNSKKLCEETKQKMIQQGTCLKQEIDEIVASAISELEMLTSKNDKILNSHESCLEKLQTKFETLVKECKSAMKSGSDILLVDMEEEITREMIDAKIPEVLRVESYEYLSCKLYRQHLKNAFGQVKYQSDQEKVVTQINPSIDKSAIKGKKDRGKSTPLADKAFVGYSYNAEDTDELTLKRGEIITILDNNAEDGWWKGEVNGKTGLFPCNYVVALNHIEEKAKVLYSYDAKSEDELPLEVGQIITILNKTLYRGWWIGELDGKVGCIPSHYVTTKLSKGDL